MWQKSRKSIWYSHNPWISLLDYYRWHFMWTGVMMHNFCFSLWLLIESPWFHVTSSSARFCQASQVFCLKCYNSGLSWCQTQAKAFFTWSAYLIHLQPHVPIKQKYGCSHAKVLHSDTCIKCSGLAWMASLNTRLKWNLNFS